MVDGRSCCEGCHDAVVVEGCCRDAIVDEGWCFGVRVEEGCCDAVVDGGCCCDAVEFFESDKSRSKAVI